MKMILLCGIVEWFWRLELDQRLALWLSFSAHTTEDDIASESDTTEGGKEILAISLELRACLLKFF